jgi:hypothetical protein
LLTFDFLLVFFDFLNFVGVTSTAGYSIMGDGDRDGDRGGDGVIGRNTEGDLRLGLRLRPLI